MATSLPDLYRGLAALLRAGVVMEEAVGALRANGTLKEPLGGELQDAVHAGQSLSAVLARHPSAVTREDLALIEAGELTGHLDETLERLATLHDERRTTRRRFLGENAYNVLLLHFCAVLIPFGLLHASGDFTVRAWRFWVLVLLGPLYGAAAVVYLVSRTEAGRERLRRLLEWIPGFGSAARHLRRARFARVLEAAYESGMPIEQAIALSGRAVRSAPAETAALTVREGGPLTATLAATGLLSPRAIQQLDSGERAGEVSKALRGIGAEESVEAELALKRAMTVLSKGVYAAVALLVLWYALTMIGKIYG